MNTLSESRRSSHGNDHDKRWHLDAKPLLSENELWEALNKGDEIEVMHLADDVDHTWKLTGTV